MTIQVPADPYPWPFDGGLDPSTLALVVIDMQTDFCGRGGYIDSQGIDLSATRGAIAPIRSVLDEARRHPDLLVVHTREGHRPELVDLPEVKRWRSKRVCPGIGEMGPCGRILVRGEPGWEIIPELAPASGEIVIDKPGKGAFFATPLQAELQARGITKLVLMGVTTEVCVQTTMREANDRGYDSLLVEDGTESYFPEFKAATLAMITAQGGIVGWTAPAAALMAALAAHSSTAAPAPALPE